MVLKPKRRNTYIEYLFNWA